LLVNLVFAVCILAFLNVLFSAGNAHRPFTVAVSEYKFKLHICTLCLLKNRNSGKSGKFQKDKVIPVMGHGSLQGCLMSRLPHTLDVRLTDGGEVVSSMHAFMV
jgi:hypothetical protein